MFLKQILDGLNYMHSRSVCHLDLKPENIVLKNPDTKEVKIIDFGTARNLSICPDVKVMVGTPEFIAPEVLNYDPVSCAADMWAIGVITFCLLTGCSPFLGDNDGDTFQNVTLGEFDFPEPDPDEGYDDISDPAKDFITKLLVRNPRKRLTSQQSLEHQWIGGFQHTKQSRINTDRLRKLRRRRKLLAAIQAVRLSVGLFRTFSKPASEITRPNMSEIRSRVLSEQENSLSSSLPSSSNPAVSMHSNGATVNGHV